MIKAYHGTGIKEAEQIMVSGVQGPSHWYVDDQDMKGHGAERELAHPDDLSALELAKDWHQDGVVVEINIAALPGFDREWIGQDEGDGGSCWVAEVEDTVPVHLVVIHVFDKAQAEDG